MLGTCPSNLNSRSSKTFYRGQCGRNVSLNALRAAVACRKCILSFAGHTVLYRAKLSLTVLAADFLIDYKNSLVFSLSKRPRRPFLPRIPFPTPRMPPSDDPEAHWQTDVEEHQIDDSGEKQPRINIESQSSGMYVGSFFDEPLPPYMF